jgi:2-(3-amino-3-carboxypropyl)histidine synthase
VHPSGGVERIHEELIIKHQKIKAAWMHRFKEAKTVGILVSTKPGQERMKQALGLKAKLAGSKETFIFAANEIKPDCFVGYNVDAWVNTACPRIGEDAFDRPVVDISDVEKM